MTPLHENYRNRQGEEDFRRLLLTTKGLDLVKMPRKYVVDFVAYDDETLHSLWEFKQRRFAWGEYSTVFFPLYKMVWVRQYRVLMPEIPVYFAVEDINGVIKKAPLPDTIDHYWVSEGGRDSSAVREDPSDSEPVYEVHINMFEDL